MYNIKYIFQYPKVRIHEAIHGEYNKLTFSASKRTIKVFVGEKKI